MTGMGAGSEPGGDGKTWVVLCTCAVLIFVGVVGWLGWHLFSGSERRREGRLENIRYNPLVGMQNMDVPVLFRLIDRMPVGIPDPAGICTLPDGRIAVTGNGVLVLLGPDGREDRRVPLPGISRCVTAKDDGILFAALEGSIAVCSPEGEIIDEWPLLNEKSFVTSLATDSSRLFAADAGNRLVLYYDFSGKLVNTIGRKESEQDGRQFVIPSPYFDLAVDGSERLWVVNPGNLRVEQRGEDGSINSSWGKPGISHDSFCGCCNPSHIAIGPGNRFFTSEKGLNRLKVIDSSGIFLGLLGSMKTEATQAPPMDLAVDTETRVYALDLQAAEILVFQEEVVE